MEGMEGGLTGLRPVGPERAGLRPVMPPMQHLLMERDQVYLEQLPPLTSLLLTHRIPLRQTSPPRLRLRPPRHQAILPLRPRLRPQLPRVCPPQRQQ